MKELIERLRWLVAEYEAGRWRRYEEVKQALAEAADALERYQWTPFTQKPPGNEPVLWLIQSDFGVGYEIHTYVDIPGRRSVPAFGSHWMRLPPEIPPESDE